MQYTTFLYLVRVLVALILIAFFAGCAHQLAYKPEANTTSTPVVPNNSDWDALQPALDHRRLTWTHQNHDYQAHVFRLNKDIVQWNLQYSQQPKRLQDWADGTNADVVFNGAFFTETYEPTGLFIVDGHVVNDLAYTADTVGTIRIKNGRLHTSTEMKKEGEEDAFQSFPYLIRPGGSKAVIEESGKLARRTVLAGDGVFDYIFIFDATPISLSVAAEVLSDTDFKLDWALNLDGGPSSGLIARGDNETVSLLPAAELPIVLTATIVR